MSSRILIIVLTGCIFASSSFGATLTVRQDGTGDHATIGAALIAAANGDVIDVGPGTYPEALQVTKSVTLVAPAGPESTVLDGQNARRQMHVDGPHTVVIAGFHFTNGYGDNGSALLIWNGPMVTVENCRFTKNHAYQSNTLHVRHTGTKVVVRDCQFLANTCEMISAAVGVGVGGYTLLEASVFADNVAGQISGAVNCNGAILDVRGCLFLRNRSSNTGALVYTGASGRVEKNTFYANSGPLHGSAYLESGVLFRQNIVVSEQAGPGVTLFGAEHGCNLFYDNAGDPMVGSEMVFSEIQAEPQFCDWQSDDFSLCSTSPALAIINGCGRMGAFTVGCEDCGPVAIEAESWGSVKAMFR